MSGDLIQDKPKYYHEYIELCNKLKKPYYLMMGNHDIRNSLKHYISNKKLINKNGLIFDNLIDV